MIILEGLFWRIVCLLFVFEIESYYIVTAILKLSLHIDHSGFDLTKPWAFEVLGSNVYATILS